MVGTPVLAAWVAQLAFWALLVLGVVNGVLTKVGAAVFVVLWSVGYFGFPWLASWAGLFVTPWLAVLDIALVFMIFRGDVKLT